MKVLVLADYYPPGSMAGGPIRSISRLCDSEGARHDVTVITRDRDLGGQRPYTEEARLAVSRNSSVEVMYSRPKYTEILTTLRRLTTQDSTDIVYINSIFSPKFALWPLLLLRLGLVRAERVLLAPRGELAASALALKAGKKRFVGALLKMWGLPHDVVWHATSAHEAADIKRFMRGRQVNVVEQACSGPAPTDSVSIPPNREALQIVQAGRIVPIKNLLLTLRSLAKTTARVNLRIVGLREDLPYWQDCETVIRSLPPNVSVSAEGHLTPEYVRLALMDADAMILPTRGESFGQAIAESLAVGCPVLIPPTTMWTDLVKQGAGHLIDTDDTSRVVDALESQFLLRPEERSRQRSRTHQLYTDWWHSCNSDQESVFTLCNLDHPSSARGRIDSVVGRPRS